MGHRLRCRRIKRKDQHHVRRQLPLDIKRPREVFGRAGGILSLPPIHCVAVGETGIDRWRQLIGGQPFIKLEGGRHTLRRIVELILADEAGEMTASLDGGDT